MTTPPIGISGYAGSGKTTVADYITSRYGYQKRHIAEPLRRMLRSLLTDFGMAPEEITEYLTGSLKEQVIPCLGVTSRRAQITLGTEWGRKQVHPDLWASLWSLQAEGKADMNDSVRFPNEEDAIRRSHGITILVTRPGTGPAAFRWGAFGRWLHRTFGIMWGVHDSERVDRLNPDYVIVNDGSLEILRAKVDSVMTDIAFSPITWSPTKTETV